MFHSVLIEHPYEISEPKETAPGQHLYFEVLELQPIMLQLSFMRTERISSEEKYVSTSGYSEHHSRLLSG